jgi:hypothetical protein
LLPPTGNGWNVIPTIHMNGASKAYIYHYNGTRAYNLTSDVTPFSFNSDGAHGLRVNFDCQKGFFAMSYVTVKQDDLVIELDGNEDFLLSSPLYPSSYPLGTKQTYNITAKDNKTHKGFYIGFETFNLIEPTLLVLNDNQFHGSKQYPDMIIPGPQITGSFLAESTSVSSPKTGFGFAAPIVALTCGEQITESKNLNTNDFPKPVSADTRCMWVIKHGLPANNATGISLNITVTLGNLTNIQPRNLSALNNAIAVYDGESAFRSPLMNNVMNGASFQALSNSMVIIYEPYRANLTDPLTINVSTVACSTHDQNMCIKAQTCMMPSWRCNGRVECGDGSDELNCNGPTPAPTPAPTPTPDEHPSSGYKTAFWICVPLALILGAMFTKFGPTVIKRIRESRYQQFHDLPDH